MLREQPPPGTTVKVFKKIIKNTYAYEDEDIDRLVSILIEHNIRPSDLSSMEYEQLPESLGTAYQRATICMSAKELAQKEKQEPSLLTKFSRWIKGRYHFS